MKRKRLEGKRDKKWSKINSSTWGIQERLITDKQKGLKRPQPSPETKEWGLQFVICLISGQKRAGKNEQLLLLSDVTSVAANVFPFFSKRHRNLSSSLFPPPAPGLPWDWMRKENVAGDDKDYCAPALTLFAKSNEVFVRRHTTGVK
jgi:hypothetical protein